jgi:hypothetical protein
MSFVTGEKRFFVLIVKFVIEISMTTTRQWFTKANRNGFVEENEIGQ